MNKTELVEQIATDLRTSNLQAGVALGAVLRAIEHGLAKEGYVGITGFGAFERVRTAPRPGHNPHTGETIQLAASVRVSFRSGRSPKQTLRRPTTDAHQESRNH